MGLQYIIFHLLLSLEFGKLVAMTPIDKWDCNTPVVSPVSAVISLVAMTPIDKWDCNEFQGMVQFFVVLWVRSNDSHR